MKKGVQPGYGFNIIFSPAQRRLVFFSGWKLVSLPGIRRYVILPLLINIILMGGAFWWLFTRLESWIPSLMSHVPDWLQWLNYLLWPVAVISVLLVFGYFFSTIANWIAAPFNGCWQNSWKHVLPVQRRRIRACWGS